MSERRCPKCGTVYADSARFCPRDGSMLLEVPAKPGTPRPAEGSPSGGGTAVRTPPQAKPGLDRASSLLGEVLDSRYEVQKKLGEGGMSYVYLAREVSTGHDVAIKVLSPKLATDRSSVERLRREAGLAMRLDHPNVCRILRLGESEDGLIYLVMPFLKGELLADREVNGGPMHLAAGDDVDTGDLLVEDRSLAGAELSVRHGRHRQLADRDQPIECFIPVRHAVCADDGRRVFGVSRHSGFSLTACGFQNP